MARDAQNPVKLRAQLRARQIGKTLGQVYDEAGVNKAYLTEVPKTGWRENKLREIAQALEWSFDQLMRGDEAEQTAILSHDKLIGMAAEVAARLMAANIGGERSLEPLEIGRLTVKLYHTLRDFVSAGLAMPSDAALGVIARQLLAAMRNASSTM